jgi:hypothetical protein
MGYATTPSTGSVTVGGAGVIQIPAMAKGGLIKAKNGYPRGTDTIPIMATEGEMILNKRQQINLLNMLDKGGAGKGMPPVQVNITAMDSADVYRTLENNKDAFGAFFQNQVLNNQRGVRR